MVPKNSTDIFPKDIHLFITILQTMTYKKLPNKQFEIILILSVLALFGQFCVVFMFLIPKRLLVFVAAGNVFFDKSKELFHVLPYSSIPTRRNVYFVKTFCVIRSNNKNVLKQIIIVTWRHKFCIKNARGYHCNNQRHPQIFVIYQFIILSFISFNIKLTVYI